MWWGEEVAFAGPPCWKVGNPSLRPASRGTSQWGSRNGSPVRTGRPGLGRQDVERVCFLFVLEVCFPANTCLAALPLSWGSQGQHSIAHERSWTNKPWSSMQASCQPVRPALAMQPGAQEQSGPEEGREEKQFWIPGAEGLWQTAVVRGRKAKPWQGARWRRREGRRMLSLGAAAQGRVATRMGWGTVYSWELGQLALKDSTCSLHIMRRGASLEIQWLRLQVSTAGGAVWSLVGELRSQVLNSVAKRFKKIKMKLWKEWYLSCLPGVGCRNEGSFRKRQHNLLEKPLMLGKIEGRRRRGRQDEMAGWHHQLDGHEFEHAPGVGDGQGALACCSPRSHRVRHDWATEQQLFGTAKGGCLPP